MPKPSLLALTQANPQENDTLPKSLQLALFQENNTFPSFIIAPSFHIEHNLSKDEAIMVAAYESIEVVWLNAIRTLSAEDLGVSPDIVEPLKAGLILLAHELYHNLHSWNLKYIAFLIPHMKSLPEYRLKKFKALSQLEKEIFLEVDYQAHSFYELFQKIDTKMKESATLLAGIKESMGIAKDMVGEGLVYKEVAGGIRKFNLENKERIEELKQDALFMSVKKRCEYWDLKDISGEMTALHQEYLDFYTQFWITFEGMTSRLQTHILGLSDDCFSTCYQNAFKCLSDNITTFPMSFLLEFYLQQARKPQFMGEWHNSFTDSFNIYLKSANDFLSSVNQPTLTMEQLVDSLDPSCPPPSLHELIDQARTVLMTPLKGRQIILRDQNLLQLSNETCPVLSTKEEEEESSALYQTVDQTAASSVVCLFNDPKSIPGRIEMSQVALLKKMGESLSSYHESFSGFSSDPMCTKEDENRLSAIACFNKALEETSSLEEISALLEAAKPTINRHRHFFWDMAVLGKEHTNTWKVEFKKARLKALTLLKEEIKTKTVEEAKDFLSTWRSQSLFAHHRNESWIQGAFGRTCAQKEIDELLDELSMVENSRGLSNS